MTDMLGPFEIRGEIGRGAMAVVWRAYDPRLYREVAIKEPLIPAWADANERAELVERFIREGRAAALLNHPGIITIYAAEEYDGRPAIVMELVEGYTLGALIQRGPLAVQAAVEILDQLLDAAGYAHAHGIVHRDIKPENIFVTADGRVKLADFGIAHLGETGSSTLTQAGTVMGSPGYMSPEQVAGAASDARSDIFAIGAIAYEMLAGRNPFGATDGLAPTAIMYRVVHEMPAPLEVIAPQLPGHLGVVVATALAKEPERRFQTAEAFRAALHDPTALTRPAVPPAAAPAAPAWPQAQLTPTAPGIPASGPGVSAPRPNRGRTVVIAMVIAGVVVLGGLALFSSAPKISGGPSGSASTAGGSPSAADAAAYHDADQHLNGAETTVELILSDVAGASTDDNADAINGLVSSTGTRSGLIGQDLTAAKASAEKLSDSQGKTDLLAAIDAEGKAVSAFSRQVEAIQVLSQIDQQEADLKDATEKLTYTIQRANGSSYGEMRKAGRAASADFSKSLKYFSHANALFPGAGLNKWVEYCQTEKERADLQTRMSAEAKAGQISSYNQNVSKSNSLMRQANSLIQSAVTLDSSWTDDRLTPLDDASQAAVHDELDLHTKASKDLGFKK
jgi:serine/threonine protein kinase